MKTVKVAVLILAAAALAIPAPAQSQADQQKAMEMYMKLGAVNENHAYFKKFAGDWTVTAKMWVFPGSEATVSQNKAHAELILGGRFLAMTFEGTMMGQPFEGRQLSGYDNLIKKYITLWTDNTSTAFYLTTGVLDPATNTMTETGLWPDPMSGGEVKVRNVVRFVGPDEFTYESYMTLPDGKEFKSLEQRGVRSK